MINNEEKWQAALNNEEKWHATLNNEEKWQAALNNEEKWQAALNNEEKWHATLNNEEKWHATLNNEEKWQAALNNDKDYDGKFFYAVKSTGIFCRPSCKSKTPLRENIEYFETPEAAMEAGYRPCKRCRPDLLSYQPMAELAEQAKSIIDRLYIDKAALSHELKQLGISRRHLTEVFATQYSCTPNEYAADRRIEKAKAELANGSEPVIDIALSSGFGSLSAFYTLFKKHTDMSPGAYRSMHRADGEAEKSYFVYDSMLGNIAIGAAGEAVTTVQFADGLPNCGKRRRSPVTDLAASQIEEYLSGKRKIFDVPIHPVGTVFQKSVWETLQRIPYGHVMSYKQVAEMAGNPNASRAVGMANNKNPLLILIPCHRVVGANGFLVGYAGPLDIKRQLLDLEQRNL